MSEEGRSMTYLHNQNGVCEFKVDVQQNKNRIALENPGVTCKGAT